MGSVTRRTLAALLVAAPLSLASVTLAGTATAYPQSGTQAGDAKVGTTADFKFDPPAISVAAGGKVTWENTDGSYHTVTGGDGAADPNSPIKRGELPSRGTTYSITFTTPGTYSYFCEPHVSLGMKGTVTVTAAGTQPTATATTSAPAASSAPPASATASATVGAPQEGAGAPTAEADHEEGEEGHEEAPGIAGNKTLESIEAERASQAGAVSGFRFFAAVATAFLFILGAAVMFSTRPRRAGR